MFSSSSASAQRARVYRVRGPKERVQRLRERGQAATELIGRELELKALRDAWRDVLVTRVMDAEPDHRTMFPDNSIWPLVAALATAVMFVGSIFSPWAVVWGSVPVAIALTAWFWPTHKDNREHLAREKKP